MLESSNRFQQGSAAEGKGESSVKFRRCPAAVKGNRPSLSTCASQNTRRISIDEDRIIPTKLAHRHPSTLLRSYSWLIAAILATPALLAMLVKPAFAHHPFAMPEAGNLNALQGLISGVGHPLLGPDHLLFLLAIGFVGLNLSLIHI